MHILKGQKNALSTEELKYMQVKYNVSGNRGNHDRSVSIYYTDIVSTTNLICQFKPHYYFILLENYIHEFVSLIKRSSQPEQTLSLFHKAFVI